MQSVRHISTLFHATGHLAVWVGLYVTGAAVCFSQISGMESGSAVLWAAGLTAMSVYLLDRVKLADPWLDPADREAHPDRFAFLGSRSRSVRILALVLGLVAMALATQIHVIAVSFVPLAALGVLGYAGLPHLAHRAESASARATTRFRRVKDVLLLKNIAVAVCITGFVGLLTFLDSLAENAGSSPTTFHNAANVVIASLFVFAIVLADAIMCDIDDAPADLKHGTATIPNRFGTRAAWIVAAMLHGIAATLLLVSNNTDADQERRIWAGLVCASFILIALARPKTLRDLIDARLAILAIVASLIFKI